MYVCMYVCKTLINQQYNHKPTEKQAPTKVRLFSPAQERPLLCKTRHLEESDPSITAQFWDHKILQNDMDMASLRDNWENPLEFGRSTFQNMEITEANGVFKGEIIKFH